MAINLKPTLENPGLTGFKVCLRYMSRVYSALPSLISAMPGVVTAADLIGLFAPLDSLQTGRFVLFEQ